MEIRQPKNKEELEQCLGLRYRILRKAWGQPRGSERDEEDKTSFHIAAFDCGRAIGTGRLQMLSPRLARIRYMAVDESWRGRGTGAAMLAALEGEARSRGASRVTLNAREGAVRFYEERGYAMKREVEKLFGVIRHFRMEKKL